MRRRAAHRLRAAPGGNIFTRQMQTRIAVGQFFNSAPSPPPGARLAEFDMRCGVCWDESGIGWECAHPGCEHAMCTECAETFWCGDEVCDAVCLNRTHRVPWNHVLETLPKKGVRNLASAMAKRAFDEQGARFNGMIVEGEARERRKLTDICGCMSPPLYQVNEHCSV